MRPSAFGAKWEPSGEPSSADMGPHQALNSFRFLSSSRYLAILSHIGRRQGSRSHRGGQGFKSPQLHPSFPGQTPLGVNSAPAVCSPGVRFWEPVGSGPWLWLEVAGLRAVATAKTASTSTTGATARRRSPSSRLPRQCRAPPRSAEHFTLAGFVRPGWRVSFSPDGW